MKREYTKPMLAFESFQLDAAIAAGCVNKLHYGQYECHEQWSPEETLFSFVQCDIDLVGDGQKHFTECYHGPIFTGPENTFFHS